MGARVALLAGQDLGPELPRVDKRLLIIAETDGCRVDGIVAATFIDTHTEDAIRITLLRRIKPPNVASLFIPSFPSLPRVREQSLANGLPPVIS
jgi:formylmethanofuran dehydrogenase subunit E